MVRPAPDVSRDADPRQSAFRRTLLTSGLSIIGAKARDDTANVFSPSGPATMLAERGSPSIIEISPK